MKQEWGSSPCAPDLPGHSCNPTELANDLWLMTSLLNAKLLSFLLLTSHIKPKKPTLYSLFSTLHPRETSL